MASHKNFSYSTVATAPSPADSGTSLTVAAGEGANFVIGRNAVICPTATFPLTTNAEIVTITNIVGDVLTITRAQESTVARVVVVTDQIFNAITAKVVNDLEQAVSVVSNALSAETSARAAKDNTLSDGISVVSAAVVVASALASTADAHANTVSAAVVVASALASVADAHANTVSAAVVAVSASLTSVASIASAAASAAAAVSANHTSLVSDVGRLSVAQSAVISDIARVSLNVSAMSTKVDVVSAAVAVVSASVTSVNDRVSAISSNLTSLANRVSANSGTGGGGGSVTSAEVVDAVSVETANRISADNVVSAAVAVVSASVTSVNDRVSAISSNLTSLANRVSANSGTGGGGSVTSAKVVDAVSVETANRVSADNVLSAAIVVASALASVANAHANTVSAAVVVASALASVADAHANTVSAAVVVASALATTADTHANTASAAANTVSAAVVSVNDRVSGISTNHTSLVSDVGRISLNVSAMSTKVETVSAAANTVSAAVVTLSASLTSVASIASAAASAAAAASGAAAAVSANLTSLRSDVGRLSVVVSALNAGTGSVTSAELGAAVSIGQILSLQNVDGSAASAGCPVYAFTSANTFKLGNASATSAKHIVGLVIDSNIAISAVGRIQTQGQVTLTTAQWDSITGGSGGLTAGSTYYLDAANGKMTTTAPSVTIRRPIGIGLSTTVMFLHNAQEWDALSDAVSVGTATANALSLAIVSVASIASAAFSAAAAVSANHTSLASDVGRLSQIVSAVGVTGQLAVVAGSQTAFSAATKISGLSVSLANQVYDLEGMIAFSTSGTGSIDFGFSTSAAAFGVFLGRWEVMLSVVSGVSVGATGGITIGTFNTQAVAQVVAVTGSTGQKAWARVNALIRVTTPGSIQLKGTAVTGGPMTILQGSFLRTFRIG